LQKWLQSIIKTGILHTQKKYILENDTHLRKKWSLLCDSKNLAMRQKKQKNCKMRGRKRFPQEKKRESPMQQERTKTQNYTKVADTTKK